MSSRHLIARATPAKQSFGDKRVTKRNLVTRSRRARSQRGFTLVEILACLMFLAIAIPAILSAVSASSRSAEAAERSAIAGQLAENQLSQVIMDATSTTGTTSGTSSDRGDFGTDYPGYRYEVKQEPWTVSGDMTQYTIQVFFSVKGQERSVELSTVASLNATTQ